MLDFIFDPFVVFKITWNKIHKFLHLYHHAYFAATLKHTQRTLLNVDTKTIKKHFERLAVWIVSHDSSKYIDCLLQKAKFFFFAIGIQFFSRLSHITCYPTQSEFSFITNFIEKWRQCWVVVQFWLNALLKIQHQR